MVKTRTPHATPSKRTRASAAASANAATITDAATVIAAASDTTVTTATTPQDASDANELFDGIKFYLSRDLSPERRSCLRMLIKDNGGAVLSAYATGVVQLVTHQKLKVGEDWVSEDFVFDSVRDRVRRDVRQYMALDPTAVPSTTFLRTQTQAQAQSASTPPAKIDGRKAGRTPYTVQEDAALLQFVMEHAPHKRPMEDVPLSVFGIAERMKLLDRTAQGMHQRYRAHLKTLTPKERANTIKNANDERNAQLRQERVALEATREAETAAAAPSPSPATRSPVNGTKKVAATAAASALDDASSSPLAVERPASTADSPTSTAKPSAPTSATKSPSTRAAVATASPRNDTVNRLEAAERSAVPVTSTADAAAAEVEIATTETKTTGDSEPGAASGKPRHGVFFCSRWATIIHDTSNREQLQQFFSTGHPPPTVAAAAQPSATRASVEGETRRRKRAASATPAPTPAAAREQPERVIEDAAAVAPSAAVRKQRKLRQQSSATASAPAAPPSSTAAPTQLVEPSVQPAPPRDAGTTPSALPAATTTITTTMTATPPPSMVSLPASSVVEDMTSEATIQQLIRQIQFATNQDVNAIVHALFYASGDVDVAVAFLEGASPSDLWSHDDDVLLEPLMRAGVTARAVADAQQRGAFARMRVQRSTAQILTRIRYLL